MKKTIKLIFVILMSITLIFSVPFYSNAVKKDVLQEDFGDGGVGDTAPEDQPEDPPEESTGSTPSNLGGLIGSANGFLNAGQGAGGVDSSKLKGIFNFISGVLLSIATGITATSAVIMGINFTIQSVEDKAKVKESMVPWVIGIIIAFGAYGIWRITMSVFLSMGI